MWRPEVANENLTKQNRRFFVQNEGSIFLLQPSQEWIRDNISPDRMMFGDAVVVEHRFILDLIEGILADGLEVG
jgi:hypothetical protein